MKDKDIDYLDMVMKSGVAIGYNIKNQAPLLAARYVGQRNGFHMRGFGWAKDEKDIDAELRDKNTKPVIRK